MVAFLYSCSASYCRSTILLPSESLPPPQSPVRFSPSTAVPLRLRGGSIVEDLLSQEDSGASSSSYDESLYNLTAGCLIDPEEQGNLTRVYDLFIRPPLLPPMKDGRQLSGIGLILTRTPPYTIQSIHPQVRQTHEGLLNVGDELVAINGESLKGKSWEQVRSLAIGEEATQVLLQVVPQLKDEEGKQHPSASTVSVELTRFSDYVPPACKPLPDDPGRGKGEEEQKFLELHRQKVAEELAGIPLLDFGSWTKLRDPKTGRTFFHDRMRNISQWHPPASYFARKKLLKMSQAEFMQTALTMQAQHEGFVSKLRQKRLAALSLRSEEEEEAERARIDEENLLADLRMSGIDPKDFEASIDRLDKDLLAMGVNFSAIPDKASRQIMSRFAAKFENITSDEHGPSDNESEKWMQTLRSLDVGDILTKEDLNKVFFKREPENPPMVQFADPAFLDFLRQCKELGRGDESVDKAIATCEAAWKVLHEFDQYLEREPWKEREIERAVKSLMPHLPQDVPLDYYAFRDIARRQEEMKSKGWEWGSTLLHGVDPIYDRIDFRRVDFEDGRLQIMYVGDCVPGGYVEKEQVIVR